ncbi:MAG: hypothetical protein WKF47_15810 [Geodermatophilaceae bacterium]
MVDLWQGCVLPKSCGVGDQQEDQWEDLLLPGGVGAGGGKPRIVEQKYLGTAEDVAAAVAGGRLCRPARSTWRSGISRRPGG